MIVCKGKRPLESVISWSQKTQKSLTFQNQPVEHVFYPQKCSKTNESILEDCLNRWVKQERPSNILSFMAQMLLTFPSNQQIAKIIPKHHRKQLKFSLARLADDPIWPIQKGSFITDLASPPIQQLILFFRIENSHIFLNFLDIQGNLLELVSFSEKQKHVFKVQEQEEQEDIIETFLKPLENNQMTNQQVYLQIAQYISKKYKNVHKIFIKEKGNKLQRINIDLLDTLGQFTTAIQIFESEITKSQGCIKGRITYEQENALELRIIQGSIFAAKKQDAFAKEVQLRKVLALTSEVGYLSQTISGFIRDNRQYRNYLYHPQKAYGDVFGLCYSVLWERFSGKLFKMTIQEIKKQICQWTLDAVAALIKKEQQLVKRELNLFEQSQHHEPEVVKHYKYCRQCSTRNDDRIKTKFICKGCTLSSGKEIALCLDCFQQYHEKEIYVNEYDQKIMKQRQQLLLKKRVKQAKKMTRQQMLEQNYLAKSSYIDQRVQSLMVSDGDHLKNHAKFQDLNEFQNITQEMAISRLKIQGN